MKETSRRKFLKQVAVNDYPSLIDNEKPLHSNVSSIGDSIAWYGTSKGRVFKTTNKGVTWSIKNNPQQHIMYNGMLRTLPVVFTCIGL